MLQGLCCESRLAQPVLLDQLGSTGLLLPAAIATESRGGGRSCSKLMSGSVASLLESPSGFADPKENAIFLITELHSVPALPPSYIPQQGFIVPFQSDVLISNSPVFLWLSLLIPFPELMLLCLPCLFQLE